MSASKRLNLVLLATLPLCASLGEARDAKASEAPVLMQPTEQVLVPDEARIASDLKGHALFTSAGVLNARLDAADEADWTTIRSSVRNGEVLEFRVTSLYEADAKGGPQREVHAIVSYELGAEGWTLVAVKTEGTRYEVPGQPENSGEPC